MNSPVESVASAGAKTAIPAALGGQLVFGYTLPEVAAIVGIVYTVAQLAFMLYDRFYKKDK